MDYERCWIRSADNRCALLFVSQSVVRATCAKQSRKPEPANDEHDIQATILGGTRAHFFNVLRLGKNDSKVGLEPFTNTKMANWEKAGVTISECKNCGATHECALKDYPARDRGTCNCLNCGETLHSWNSSRHHDECKLIRQGDAAKKKL